MTTYAEQQRGMFSSASVQWETPPSVFDPINAEFGFTLDAAATALNTKCERFLVDGLTEPWNGVVWCNPPYGRGDSTGRWVRRAFSEHQRISSTIVMLVPARTETAWFHDIALPHAEIRFIRRRIKFIGAEWNAPFSSCFVIFQKKV